jgi:glycine hydroxymethyltransferase
VPADPNGPWYTSGIRLGTPALTTRGLREAELAEVGDLLVDVLEATTAEGDSKVRYRVDPTVAERVRARAAELVGAHPLYPEIDLSGQG